MRDQGRHVPPPRTQPCPPDNTSRYVYAQVSAWRSTGLLIHQEAAREIAAWRQGPAGDGWAFAAFQSTGTITDDLDAAIGRECRPHPGPLDDRRDVPALTALRAYLRACTVTVWKAGSNVAGYGSEGDIYSTLDYGDAWDAWEFDLRAVPDGTDSAGECTCDAMCTCDPGEVEYGQTPRPCLVAHELCDACGLEATVGAFLRDDAPRRDSGAHGLFYAYYDHLPLPIAHWLTSEPMTYGTYLDDYRDGE